MTRTKALLVVLAFLALSAGYADVQVFVVGDRVAGNQRRDAQALCSLRDDLQARARSGRAFLKTHPHGIPGIPAATIRVGIDNEQRTLRALSPLVCPAH